MTKLSHYQRDRIAERAVAYAYDPKKRELEIAADKLAREAYGYLIPRRELNVVLSLPKHWIHRAESLAFNANGYQITLHLIGEPLPKPAGWRGAFEPGPICDAIQKHAQAVEAYKKDRKDAQNQVRGMLNSAPTIKRLREIWPEGEAFYADLAVARQLPAVSTEAINQRLGLPPE